MGRRDDQSPWALTAIVAGVIAFYASAPSLQIGDGVAVTALTSLAANRAAITDMAQPR